MKTALFIGAKRFIFFQINDEYIRVSYSVNKGFSIVFDDPDKNEYYIPDAILKKCPKEFSKTISLLSDNCLMLAKLSNGVVLK